ncbi:Uncharacterized protein AXF42_Ash000906 [Apostasia shenzhenica]|uniref:Succinate dehydrogenase subunit 5, mitochondrial n=1 Tax=Apostasia shenzhenica TaxID=1088818 RepID=A0A2I0ATD7_9ASPA|nr:Uncharacterized protein AXF42_Ash000906 [Apostasia shenzhenica]
MTKIASLWRFAGNRFSSPSLSLSPRLSSLSFVAGAASASDVVVRLFSADRRCIHILNKRDNFLLRRQAGTIGHHFHDLQVTFFLMAGIRWGSGATATSHFPVITDPEIQAAFKDLMAVSWDEIPESVINETKKALSKATDDKVGKVALENVFRAAEASVEFGSTLVSLRMALDDLCGLSGENVGHLPEYLEDAMRAAYKRYMTYLDSFGPDEAFLRKKIETELGTKMIHLKMRCSGIGSEWGKVTLLGTSGISGSYVEHRA